MKFNKNKHIGRVLFIVEGSQNEFSILRRIFCNLLGYSYIEKRRNRPSYFISTHDRIGKDTKAYIGANTDIQTNKISEETLIKAAYEFLKYLKSEKIEFDIDEFAPASHAVFTKQETEYLSGVGFRLFSMMTLAFFQMGILEMESQKLLHPKRAVQSSHRTARFGFIRIVLI